MSDNDYGFYGSGLDGYVHYKQSFDNISGGDVSTDSSDSFCGEDSFCDFSNAETNESPDVGSSKTKGKEARPKEGGRGQSREEAYTIIAVMLAVIMVVALLNTAIS